MRSSRQSCVDGSAATGAGPTYNLKKLKGSVTADGSSTVGPYTTAAAELFRGAGATGVKVTVGISGTGGGFQRFCKGEIDLSDASRPMRNTEAKACKTRTSARGARSRSRTTR